LRSCREKVFHNYLLDACKADVARQRVIEALDG